MQLLQGGTQRMHGIDPLEQGAGGFGVLADPVADVCHLLDGAQRQHVGQGGQRGRTAEVQRGRGQKEPPLHAWVSSS